MWYKTYGKTDKKISAVSFGGMRFANQDDTDGNAEIVRYAFDKGINYFDTAPGYGRSEDIFGAAFRGMDREKFYVSTKSSQSQGEGLRADLEKSLERMGVEYVDFFHIWWVLSMDAYRQRVDGGAVREALKARDEGLIRHVVISSHMPGEDLETVLTDGPFEGVTLGYCAINFPYREQAVQTAGRLGLGVVTMNPLGGGIIPQNPERLNFLRGPEDPSVVTAAIRFNVSHPDITSALIGFTTREHIDEAVGAVEGFQPYDEAHTQRLRERIVGEMDQLCTGCRYCLPCPEGVPIPQLMDVYNQKLLGTDEAGLRGRLKWHWGLTQENAKACSQCGACEDRCTQHLPIRERLTEIADLPQGD
jgi:uncharacterized protein